MAKKQVGYVELEWTCKRCGIKNPGTQKTCSGCGGPMDMGDNFELPEQQNLIADKEKIEQAKKGADIHCPYCGTRNPAGTLACSQCNGDLSEGKKRQQGQVLGAHSDKPAPQRPCPSCGSLNPASAQHCSKCGGSLSRPQAAAIPAPAPAAAPRKSSPKWLIIIGGIILACLCLGALGIFLLKTRTSEISAVVRAVAWERQIAILEIQPVEYQDWQDQIPNSAQILSCQQKYYETVSEYVPGSEEVCGTAYVVDQGGGVGEVVQDCEYRVYKDWCQYTVEEWKPVDQVTASGTDLSPIWPYFTLASGQREGERSETFQVQFDADGKYYTYYPTHQVEFGRYAIGSEWMLVIDGFGNLQTVNP